jgi:hypothetical protein
MKENKMEGYVAHMEEMRNAYKILVRDLKGWRYLESLGLDKSMILI